MSETSPRLGRLLSLKTLLEVSTPRHETIPVYVLELPSKSANSLLRLLTDAFPEKDTLDLHHLRRFSRPEHLPARLKSTEADAADHQPEVSVAGQSKIHLLVCPVSAVPQSDLYDILASNSPFSAVAERPRLSVIPVPKFAPTSVEQAALWSQQYWPTVYKGSNPFGPHPSIVARAESLVVQNVGTWLSLAGQAADEVHRADIGEPIGAVIVVGEGDSGVTEVLAVAGDARWHGDTVTGNGAGNPMAHAAIRAIGMVARKRRELYRADNIQPEMIEDSSGLDMFLDNPINDCETLHYDKSPAPQNGYLCTNLHIYMTHEPCIMCSMAIVHARFGKVVFARRMPSTAGLSAERHFSSSSSSEEASHSFSKAGGGHDVGGLGYGLFWRPELNWKLLAWQWNDDDPSWPPPVDIQIHA